MSSNVQSRRGVEDRSLLRIENDTGEWRSVRVTGGEKPDDDAIRIAHIQVITVVSSVGDLAVVGTHGVGPDRQLLEVLESTSSGPIKESHSMPDSPISGQFNASA